MALVIQNLCFSYDKAILSHLVLDDICLKVPKGSIYALVGPSGCGKTTMFKLVIGLHTPKSGSIRIFGYPPGSAESGVPGRGIGYMPQELSVQNNLTISELLYYFGNILGMDRQELKFQIEYLVQTLELPEKSRLIGNMSGGQQRRLSLAISILHKPRLLILDEPTVGVDPLLCEKIWRLLVSLSKIERVTIILTTHYIEETRRANRVGFMRKGEILEENSPRDVLRKYGAKTLEEAFLRISKAHIFKKSITVKWKKRAINYTEDPLPKLQMTDELLFERKIIAIIHKVMIETRRNPLTMIFLFILTFITASLMTCWFGETPSNLTVAWVVEEPRFNATGFMNVEEKSVTNDTNEVDYYNFTLLNKIREVRDVETTENDVLPDYEELPEDDWVPYIPDILKNSLNADIINLIEYDNIKTAEKDLRMNLVYGIIHLHKNFSHCYVECDVFLNIGQEFVENETIECGTIRLHIDSTNKVISDTIEYSVRDSLLTFGKELAKAFGLKPHVIERLMEVVPIYGKIDKEDLFGVDAFIAPGMILLLCYLFGYLPSIMAIVMDRGEESFIRNYVSGVTALNLVTGKFIALFVFLAISNVINTFSSIFLLGLQCYGSYLLVILICWMSTSVGILHGMLVANLLPDTIFCVFCVIGMSFSILWSSSIIWNLESQPYYIRWLQYFLPWAMPVKSLRAVMGKEGVPIHPFIWPGYAVNIIWLCISFIACVHLIKVKK